MAKFTKWFPADVMPTIPGFYECDRLEWTRGGTSRIRRVIRWDGCGWFFVKGDAVVTANRPVAMLGSDKDQWRGLASDPKASKP